MAMLQDGVMLRLATEADAAALADAYRSNREHLRPFEPRRRESFFTADGQRTRLQEQLEMHQRGQLVPWLLDDGGRVVGTVTLSGLARGPFCSAYLGYWTAADLQGRGLATAAVTEVCRIAATTLGLHRIEATTLVDNHRSQRVLTRCGFAHIGTAADYLHINGQWRAHQMFQRILHDGPPEL